MTVVTVEDSVEQVKKKKRLNTNSVLSRVGYTVRNIFGEGDGTLLQFSCLENAMDRGA